MLALATSALRARRLAEVALDEAAAACDATDGKVREKCLKELDKALKEWDKGLAEVADGDNGSIIHVSSFTMNSILQLPVNRDHS